MIKPADMAVTGINANILKMDAASNNIVNSNTPNYKGVRVPTVESVAGGTRGTPVRDTRPGSIIRHADTGKTEMSSNTSLALEFTNLMMAKSAVSANISVIKTSDELLGTLFDIKG